MYAPQTGDLLRRVLSITTINGYTDAGKRSTSRHLYNNDLYVDVPRRILVVGLMNLWQ